MNNERSGYSNINSGVLLTIGIPNYNRCELLTRLVRKVISQIDDAMRNRVEVFVCDDNSTDDTDRAMDELVKNNSNLLIRFEKNAKNLDFSRNFDKTIRKSRGRFVFLMSNDDSIADGTIHLLFDILEKHSDIALGFFASQPYDKTLTMPASKFVPGKDKYYACGAEWVNEMGVCVPCLISGWLVNRDRWIGTCREEWLSSNAIQIPIGMELMARYPCYWHRSTPVIQMRENNGVWNPSRDPLCPYSGLNAYFHASRVVRDWYPPRLYRSIYWQTVRTTCGHTIRNKVLNIPINLKEVERLLSPYYDYSWPCVIYTCLLRFLLRTPKWMLYVPFRWLVPEKM